jgi:protocatechuate 3,4-dioxygenase beta subunit
MKLTFAVPLILTLAAVTTISGQDSAGNKEFTATRASASVSGRVVEKVSGKPIEKAAVWLYRYSEPTAGAGPFEDLRRQLEFEGDHLTGYSIFGTAEAAPDGTFGFSDLPPGTYRLWVLANHYLLYEYGQRVQGERGARIPLQVGQRLDVMDLGLARKGALSGTVTDERGRPMPNVEVRIYTRNIKFPGDDTWRLIEAGSLRLAGDRVPLTSTTDESGRYRIEDIEPADYYVVARPQMAYSGPGGFRSLGELLVQSIGQNRVQPPSPVMALRKSGAGDPVPPGEAYLSVFYPDAINVAAARSVYVAADAEAQGINVTVRRTQTAVVKGAIVAPAPSAGGSVTKPSEIRVGLFVVGPGQELRQQQEDAVIANLDGTFQFNGVIPGSYRLLAAGYQSGRRMTVTQDLEVQPGSAQTLSLTLQPGIDVPGRIHLQGPVPPAFQRSAVSMSFFTGDSFSRLIGAQELQIRVVINPDGSFLVPDVIPGARYTFGYNAPNGVAVSRWTYGGASPSSPWFSANNSEATLDVRFEFGRGRVEVMVKGQDKPKESTLVLLRELDSAHRFLQASYTDVDGKAAFPSVLPGNYEVFAVEGNGPSGWYEPRFLDSLAGRGRSIHVEHGSALIEAVPVINVDRGLK